MRSLSGQTIPGIAPSISASSSSVGRAGPSVGVADGSAVVPGVFVGVTARCCGKAAGSSSEVSGSGVSASGRPACACTVRSASPNCRAKRALGSSSSLCSQSLAVEGTAVPRARIEVTMAGSTASTAVVPATPSSCAVRSPSGAVSSVSSSALRRAPPAGVAVMGTRTPTGLVGLVVTTRTLVAVVSQVVVRCPPASSVPASLRAARSGYTPGFNGFSVSCGTNTVVVADPPASAGLVASSPRGRKDPAA